MVFDSKFAKIRGYWGIWTFDDWKKHTPEDVLKVPDVGPVTLEHVRLYLSMHDVTLKGDQTPEYWKEHLQHVRIAQQITEEADEAVLCPFTILVDTAEQKPFKFVGLKSDSKQQYRPLIVKTERQCLGRHPNQFGDYSIKGFVGQVGIERKSISDLQGTLLDFHDGGRTRFEQELANLAAIPAALVVVEGGVYDVLSYVNERRKQDHALIARQLYGSIVALMQDYQGVPWFFADGPDPKHLAAKTTFKFLRRFWEKRQKAATDAVKDLAKL